MIYRIILKVGYYERWFDFETVNAAANFGQAILEHESPNEDHKETLTSITMQMIKKEVSEDELEF